MSDPQLDKYLLGVVGVVEATSFEQHALWRFNDAKLDGARLSWVETGHGFLPTVGEIDGRPVRVSVMTTTVDGHKILFFYATSAAVDHDQIDAWLKKTMPVTAFEDSDPRKRLNRSDAMNFHNVLPRVSA